MTALKGQEENIHAMHFFFHGGGNNGGNSRAGTRVSISGCAWALSITFLNSGADPGGGGGTETPPPPP
jgi:hypothetical protein